MVPPKTNWDIVQGLYTEKQNLNHKDHKVEQIKQ